MVSTKVAFGALGVACVMAAGSGAYLASRHNADDVASRAAVSAVAAEPTAKATPSVAETEGVIDEGVKAKTPPVAEAPEAPAKTHEAVAPPANQSISRTARTTTVHRPRAASPSSTRAQTSSAATGAAVPADSGRPMQGPPPAPAERDPNAPTPRPFESPAPVVESPPPPAAREPQKTFEELVVSADSVIGLQIENTLTSERARIEDRVEARVTRDVKVGDRIAVPAGSRMMGSVTQVERGGKVRERARLGVRFHTLVLADGTRVPISTDTLYREGVAPTKESAAKIGGAAVGGAVLGAILGGGKGAAAGAAAGAAGGTAVVMAGDRNPAVLAAGSNVTVRVLSPVTITIEKE